MAESIEDILNDLEECIARRRDGLAPVKGMHVPYHGPFCSAVPSVLKDLERFAKRMRATLETKE